MRALRLARDDINLDAILFEDLNNPNMGETFGCPGGKRQTGQPATNLSSQPAQIGIHLRQQIHRRGRSTRSLVGR